MAQSPDWKVYSSDNEYIGSVKYPAFAAALVSLAGDGATIRFGHRAIVWREGQEEYPANESYDYVTDLVMERVDALCKR